MNFVTKYSICMLFALVAGTATTFGWYGVAVTSGIGAIILAIASFTLPPEQKDIEASQKDA